MGEREINLASIMESLKEIPTPTPPPDVPTPGVQLAFYLSEILKGLAYHKNNPEGSFNDYLIERQKEVLPNMVTYDDLKS